MRGFAAWSRTPAAQRAEALAGAAQLLRERRLRLAALAVRECAKPWDQADADVCEAIDFLEYYARAALELDGGPPLLQPPGERNELRHRPRGVTVVISPWNFPLAIALGMTAAGLAAGNPVVLKPAEQSPGCAAEVVRALHEAGVPRDALSLVPGDGDGGSGARPRPARRDDRLHRARSRSASTSSPLRPRPPRPARTRSRASSPSWAARTA